LAKARNAAELTVILQAAQQFAPETIVPMARFSPVVIRQTIVIAG
jgi:hypothetical protein